RFRDEQSSDAGCMGLVFANRFGTKPAKPGEAIGLSAALEFAQSRDLVLVDSDDNLAALLVVDAMLAAKTVKSLPPFDTGPGLQGARFIVESGVNDSAIITGLVRRQTVLRLQNDQRETAIAEEAGGSCHTDDATPNDGHLITR